MYDKNEIENKKTQIKNSNQLLIKIYQLKNIF